MLNESLMDKKVADYNVSTYFNFDWHKNTRLMAYFGNSLEEGAGDITGYAVASIMLDDLEVRLTSKDMRISRAIRLAELFGKLLASRYSEKSDAQMLGLMLRHPALRFHWHAEPGSPLLDFSVPRKFYCNTPLGRIYETIAPDGTVAVGAFGTPSFGLTRQTAKQFIIENLQHRYETVYGEKCEIETGARA